MEKSFLATHCMWFITLVLVTGCASVPRDLGRSEVHDLLEARGQLKPAALDESLSQLLGEPITRATALKIALLNNPQMKVSYARLGFGAANVYTGSRIRNPILDGSWLDPRNGPGSTFVTLGLATSLSDLITLSARRRLTQAEFEALKLSVAQDIVSILAATELAYFDYVSAELTAKLRAKIAKTGALSATLAQRFREAGNFSPRELAIAKAAAAETDINALEAQAQAMEARAHLANLLGLTTADSWHVESELHLPVPQEDSLDELWSLALKNRLDLQASKARADFLADKYQVTGWSRWIESLEVGVERERESDGSEFRGPTLNWELPLFDQRKDRVLTAESEMKVAANQFIGKRIAVENEVRLGFRT